MSIVQRILFNGGGGKQLFLSACRYLPERFSARIRQPRISPPRDSRQLKIMRMMHRG